jgi:putative transposase
LARTFGCVRVVWNRTLAARQERYTLARQGTSYADTDRALTAMKRDPGLAFLNEVSSVPLQQALRHQHAAFQAFFAQRSRYPRFKSRRGRQSATYTRSAFSMKAGELSLGKMYGPLRFVWTWPEVDIAALEPTSVTVAKDPAGRWFVTFQVDAPAPAPLPMAGQSVGADMGLTDLTTLSTGEKIRHPRDWERHQRNLQRWQRRLARCQKGSRNRAKVRVKVARAHARIADARRDFLHKASTDLFAGSTSSPSRTCRWPTWSGTGISPARSAAPAGRSCGPCWNTRPGGTGGRWPSWIAGTPAARRALRAATCSGS